MVFVLPHGRQRLLGDQRLAAGGALDQYFGDDGVAHRHHPHETHHVAVALPLKHFEISFLKKGRLEN